MPVLPARRGSRPMMTDRDTHRLAFFLLLTPLPLWVLWAAAAALGREFVEIDHHWKNYCCYYY